MGYKRFEEIIKERGIKVSEISKATGVSQSTFSDWKAGRYVPKSDKLEAIAEYLDISPEEISEPKRKKNIIRVYHAQSASDGKRRTPSEMLQAKSEDTQIPKLQKDISERLKTKVNEAMEEILSENAELYYDDADTRELVEFLHKNPAYKVLFDATRNVKPEDINFVKEMLDKLTK